MFWKLTKGTWGTFLATVYYRFFNSVKINRCTRLCRKTWCIQIIKQVLFTIGLKLLSRFKILYLWVNLRIMGESLWRRMKKKKKEEFKEWSKCVRILIHGDKPHHIKNKFPTVPTVSDFHYPILTPCFVF